MTTLIVFVLVMVWWTVGICSHLMILYNDPFSLYPDNCIKYKHLITSLVWGMLGPCYLVVALIICFPIWLDQLEILDRPIFKNRCDE
jgi:hypothetical protein